MDCLLCKAEKLTHWYHEDELIWIADCVKCKTPMVVIKNHTMDLSSKEFNYILKVIEELFGQNVYIRREQRQIKDHLHWHIITK